MPIKMKVCNIADYNLSLKNRGKIFYLLDEVQKVWLHTSETGQDRSKFIYSDSLMLSLATLRYLLKYPYRQLQGLLDEYIKIKKVNLPIPDYSTLCKRIKKLSVAIIDHRPKTPAYCSEGVELAIDSTGINIYHTGGGHSKENSHSRKHSRYEQVRKLHVALNLENSEVLSMSMSSGTMVDADAVCDLLTRIPNSIVSVRADAAYDKTKVRIACHQRKAKQIIPPIRIAVLKKPGENEADTLWEDRNEAVNMHYKYEDMDEGIKEWKKTTAYGKRSRVEAFFGRFKTIFGFHFMSRSEKARNVELRIKTMILNRFNQHNTAIFEIAT